MAVALDDLPPLLWHSELGRSLPDVWTGERQRRRAAAPAPGRGDDLAAALRPAGLESGADGTIERHHEDRLMEMIDRFDGQPFPTTLGLARQWLNGRLRRQSSR
jgi:hypothetical protein